MSEEHRTTKVVSEPRFPVKITLTKGARDYRWQVEAYGEDVYSALHAIDLADEELRRRYGTVKNCNFHNVPFKRSKHEEDVV